MERGRDQRGVTFSANFYSRTKKRGERGREASTRRKGKLLNFLSTPLLHWNGREKRKNRGRRGGGEKDALPHLLPPKRRKGKGGEERETKSPQKRQIKKNPSILILRGTRQ